MLSDEGFGEIKSASNNFTNSGNPKVTEALLKVFNGLWKDKCERSLYLAK
jgi:hypothetical protein